jgi:hypothetical protein
MFISCLITLVLRFALLAIPALGILFTHSLPLELLFVGLWVICGILFSNYEKGTRTIIGTMHIQLPIVITWVFDLRSLFFTIPLGLYCGMAIFTVWGHYKAQFIRNESIKAEANQ